MSHPSESSGASPFPSAGAAARHPQDGEGVQEFDLFVIGAGSGGVRCARVAAQLGARVGIVERSHWGGTCVNLGCVPKKLMFYAAETGRAIADGPSYGWNVPLPEFDWPHFQKGKDAEITRLDGIYVSMLQKAGVTLFEGEAQLQGAQTIEIGPSALDPTRKPQRIRARHIVLATGSTPTRIDFPGSELCITSDQVFHLQAQPRRLAVIGGGYIGVEFSGAFRGFGSEVAISYRSAHVLRHFDDELRLRLEELMDLAGIHRHPHTLPRSLERMPDGLRLTLDDGTELAADQVIMAVGRHPAIAGLGLEKAGVRTEKGRVLVNSAFETNVPGIYAIGDISDKYNLTPTAIAEGQLLAERLYAPQGRYWDFNQVPRAVFYASPLATVGLSEQEAAVDHDLLIYTSSFTPMRQVMPHRPGKAFMKLVVDEKSDVILGAHMIGPEAADIIQIMAVAVVNGLTKTQLDHTLALHPTTAEEFVTMRTPTRRVAKGTVEALG
ncbi:glutathione-disulfide reductase [Oecophyllibacter saccharovorans]|uniref:Glutathione-disulfide reductase n=1 Tax=Oecophyllibacter saccharovorans TaxID=2558360 RepID=A0A506UM91_9PROT|nr:glutathione-disulfide reductase [Oecophyllibacter saccharovorans]